MNKITSFKGTFLSNMYPSPIKLLGYTFSCAEAAFQAFKLGDRTKMSMFEGINGYQARKLGRSIELPANWHEIRLEVMKYVVLQKFLQNQDLMQKLKQTGDAELIEENTWGDRYWGVCSGIGENHLGKILMGVREL